MFTFIFVLGEVAFRAKSKIVACLTSATLIYGIISVFGNTIAATMASKVLPDTLADPWILSVGAAFAGVFSFELILSNTNISVFGKGLLNFDGWIGRARDYAVTAAMSAQIQHDTDSAVKLAEILRKLPERDLNTYVEQYCGPGSVTKLAEAAELASADVSLYKALALATEKPDGARAVLKARRDRNP